jgi:ACT domain-containing protein
MAQKLMETGSNKMDDIAKTLKISRSTLYRYRPAKPKIRKIKVNKKKN